MSQNICAGLRRIEKREQFYYKIRPRRSMTMTTFTKMAASKDEIAPVERDEEEQAEVALCVGKLRSKTGEELTNDNPTFELSDLSDGHEEDEDDSQPSRLSRGEIVRDPRPYSASVVSHRSGVSPAIVTTEFASKKMFAYRTGLLERATEDCRRFLIDDDSDGEFHNAWLLTEIDHWDYEKEKLVLLTASSLLVVRYDFIKLDIHETRRILLSEITNLQVGDLIYPSKSLMPPRNYGGVRIHFGQGNQPTFHQRWNPWSRTVPYITFTHHLLVYKQNETDTTKYNVDDFAESLVRAVTVAHQRARITEKFRVSECCIVVESYASLASIVHNQSRLGFNLERGGVSF